MTYHEDMLNSLIISLKSAREYTDRLKEYIDIAEAEYKKSVEKLTEDFKLAKENQYQIEDSIREIALYTYNADPDKNKTINSSVKIRDTRLVRLDMPECERWCINHGSMFMKIDEREVRNYILSLKSLTNIPSFATVQVVHTATISQEL